MFFFEAAQLKFVYVFSSALLSERRLNRLRAALALVLSPFVNNKFCLKADESKTLEFGKVEVRATGIDLLYK